MIIDFSNSAAADRLLDFCVDRQIPVFFAPPGYQRKPKVEEAAKEGSGTEVCQYVPGDQSAPEENCFRLLCWHLPDSISNWWKGIITRR